MAYESQKLRVGKISKHEKIENSLKLFRRVFHEKYFVKINRQEITGTKKAPVKGLNDYGDLPV
ncbi:hypothetical protein [Pseudomonas monteilii]|uniref:hypothetical protein n=1 Tax=Pseudomonas monteilii TaxID=76759 RepID=UPI001E33A7FD|nr:hypothetical protein [Pseudomonas monteilii]MCE0930365.1 hypothetical protein [Pseudomonas monteilii]MCE0976090.1 hypothetical protein [Pseudomonas monteilii]MCE1040453.1 hypothetical protein [Pseudomonas monteilii]WJN87699.1 hypothetical protein LU680_26330 [Pseudomonas monteilii]WJO32553.1 hypothetical protein LU690_26400 [Pseudomonas monteilii]